MATLPGTVPRMVRPAPGQNYPRTGFPLEGKKGNNEGFFYLFIFLFFGLVLGGCSLCGPSDVAHAGK